MPELHGGFKYYLCRCLQWFVCKKQKKWGRPGDPQSWRREYDLYASCFDKVFSESFRMPECYHAKINDDEIELWMEYIDGVSGNDLTIEMLEQAARELGRFQGRIFKQHDDFYDIPCLGDKGFLEREFNQWHTQSFTYDFLISEHCRMPVFLKQMLMDIDDNRNMLFDELKTLPVVLCHRDFWNENIFFSGGKIRLIDWDTAGWGFFGEDIASLIVDGMDVERLEGNCHRLIPAY